MTVLAITESSRCAIADSLSGSSTVVAVNNALASDTQQLDGKPSGGGLRTALHGLRDVKVPTPRSALATTATLVAGALVTTGLIVVVDRVLIGGHVRGGQLPLRPMLGSLALLMAVTSVITAFTLPLNANTVDRRLTSGQRKRLHVSLATMGLALTLGYLWSLGIASS